MATGSEPGAVWRAERGADGAARGGGGGGGGNDAVAGRGPHGTVGDECERGRQGGIRHGPRVAVSASDSTVAGAGGLDGCPAVPTAVPRPVLPAAGSMVGLNHGRGDGCQIRQGEGAPPVGNVDVWADTDWGTSERDRP